MVEMVAKGVWVWRRAHYKIEYWNVWLKEKIFFDNSAAEAWLYDVGELCDHFKRLLERARKALEGITGHCPLIPTHIPRVRVLSRYSDDN
jgi:hypothetical protein